MKDVNELTESDWLRSGLWAGLHQNVIDDAIDQWRRRLRAWPAFGIEEDILSMCCDCISYLGMARIWFVKFVENLLIYR